MDYRKLRLWVYSVIVAAGPLATFYGLVSQEELVLWLGLGGTLLGVPAGSLAAANLNPAAPVEDDIAEFGDDEFEEVAPAEEVATARHAEN